MSAWIAKTSELETRTHETNILLWLFYLWKELTPEGTNELNEFLSDYAKAMNRNIYDIYALK